MDSLSKKIYTLTGYQFKNENLLEQAFSHDSQNLNAVNFERLEFIGDACLSLVISDTLFDECDRPEGQLSKMRAKLVRKETLAEIMKSWDLESHYKLGKSMKTSDLSDTIYADLFESLLGAIYKDSQFESLKKVIKRIFASKIEGVLSGKETFENAKSKLQEYVMANKMTMPEYILVNKTGLAHEPIYNIKLLVFEKEFISFASTIKKAEMKAADEALASIK